MPVFTGSYDPPAGRYLPLFLLGPLHSHKCSRDPRKSPVIHIGAGYVCPKPLPRSCHSDPKNIAAIPKTETLFVKSWSFQMHPHTDIPVTVFIFLFRSENDLKWFPQTDSRTVHPSLPLISKCFPLLYRQHQNTSLLFPC